MQHTIIKFPEQNNLQKYSSLGMNNDKSTDNVKNYNNLNTKRTHTYSSTAATASILCTLNG